ncbi:porin family protein [Boseaceae bacterium BT-24-1]|nr:porin family protein [Boseaceae bacterium BT-24-1]
MKTLAILSGVMVSLGIGVAPEALAADLPSRKFVQNYPVAPIAPAFTWTGFYVGANAGYGWNTNSNKRDIAFVPGAGFIGGRSSGRDGGIVAGGQIGYNYHFGPLVAGLEADIQYADLKSKHSYLAPASYYNSRSSGVDWFGTVRGRLGYAFDRTLIYGTGGFAYGDDSRTGWTLGAGVEYAFTNNITARIEGLYVNLGKGDNNRGVPNAAILGRSRDTEFGVVRAALNYKFSTF